MLPAGQPCPPRKHLSGKCSSFTLYTTGKRTDSPSLHMNHTLPTKRFRRIGAIALCCCAVSITLKAQNQPTAPPSPPGPGVRTVPTEPGQLGQPGQPDKR